MFMITMQSKLGRGFFLGWKNGMPWFADRPGKHVKKFRYEETAAAQLGKVCSTPYHPAGSTFGIEQYPPAMGFKKGENEMMKRENTPPPGCAPAKDAESASESTMRAKIDDALAAFLLRALQPDANPDERIMLPELLAVIGGEQFCPALDKRPDDAPERTSHTHSVVPEPLHAPEAPTADDADELPAGRPDFTIVLNSPQFGAPKLDETALRQIASCIDAALSTAQATTPKPPRTSEKYWAALKRLQDGGTSLPEPPNVLKHIQEAERAINNFRKDIGLEPLYDDADDHKLRAKRENPARPLA